MTYGLGRQWLLFLAGFEDDPQAVLQTLRRYVHTFFGCKECGDHFEAMAKESMDSVKTRDQAVLWLWSRHNAVNSRLAGGCPCPGNSTEGLDRAGSGGEAHVGDSKVCSPKLSSLSARPGVHGPHGE